MESEKIRIWFTIPPFTSAVRGRSDALTLKGLDMDEAPDLLKALTCKYVACYFTGRVIMAVFMFKY
jgi:hypothetical protein